MMLENDHYICNRHNASIDTRQFEADLIAEFQNTDAQEQDLLESIYHRVFSRISQGPEPPADHQLICRYLSTNKFLDFLHSRHIGFPTANLFADHWECRIPEDYDAAVLRVLGELGLGGDRWAALVQSKASDWNVSCWTQLDEYFDDHLLWHAYAGGQDGVGITIEFGVLREFLTQRANIFDRDGQVYSGRVTYESLSLLQFNKHFMFRNEKEIRFAFRGIQPGPMSISVDDIYDQFGLRISPAANKLHYDKIADLWMRYGGEDRINWPQ